MMEAAPSASFEMVEPDLLARAPDRPARCASAFSGPSKISPFHQAPVIDDDGFIVAESGAAALYIAEKAGKLIPPDFQGRMRVTQWCFAALNTVEPPLALIALGDMFGMTDEGRAQWIKLANRFFGGLERAASMAANGSPAQNLPSLTFCWPRC
jgi:hypothetical protein